MTTLTFTFTRPSLDVHVYESEANPPSQKENFDKLAAFYVKTFGDRYSYVPDLNNLVLKVTVTDITPEETEYLMVMLSNPVSELSACSADLAAYCETQGIQLTTEFS